MSDCDMIKREAEELIAFLRGAAPLHGCWFGERHHDRPAFWWRNELGRLERAIPSADARAEALKEAEKALRDWQDSLNVHRMPETAIAVGMAADVVAALITEKQPQAADQREGGRE